MIPNPACPTCKGCGVVELRRDPEPCGAAVYVLCKCVYPATTFGTLFTPRRNGI
jgi:hypothetical protein